VLRRTENGSEPPSLCAHHIIVNFSPPRQDEAWTAALGLAQTSDWRTWIVNDAVGGYVTEYEKGFTFATVKGAGHLCAR
jgi:hypothetical protein